MTKRDHEEMFLAVGRAYPCRPSRCATSTSTARAGALEPLHRRGGDLLVAAAQRARRGLRGRRPDARLHPRARHRAGEPPRDGVDADDDEACSTSAPGGPSVYAWPRCSADLGVDVDRDVTFRAGDIRHCYADMPSREGSSATRPREFEDGMAELVGWLKSQTGERSRRRRHRTSSPPAVSPR